MMHSWRKIRIETLLIQGGIFYVSPRAQKLSGTTLLIVRNLRVFLLYSSICDLERIVLKIREGFILVIVEFNIIKLHLRGRYPRYLNKHLCSFCIWFSSCLSLLNLCETFISKSFLLSRGRRFGKKNDEDLMVNHLTPLGIVTPTN